MGQARAFRLNPSTSLARESDGRIEGHNGAMGVQLLRCVVLLRLLDEREQRRNVRRLDAVFDGTAKLLQNVAELGAFAA
jgi:hypothetical protein